MEFLGIQLHETNGPIGFGHKLSTKMPGIAKVMEKDINTGIGNQICIFKNSKNQGCLTQGNAHTSMKNE